MNYKMKSNGKTIMEHFSKCGIGWYGFVVIFDLLTEDENSNENIAYLDLLHFVKEAVITSDDATPYQNHQPTVIMAIFNQKFND